MNEEFTTITLDDMSDSEEREFLENVTHLVNRMVVVSDTVIAPVQLDTEDLSILHRRIGTRLIAKIMYEHCDVNYNENPDLIDVFIGKGFEEVKEMLLTCFKHAATIDKYQERIAEATTVDERLMVIGDCVVNDILNDAVSEAVKQEQFNEALDNNGGNSTSGNFTV